VIDQEKELTFKPNLSHKTSEMAQRKFEGVSVYQRLTMQEQPRDLPAPTGSDSTFQPAINPISDELDNRTKLTQGGKERWQTLYELGQKKKEELQTLQKTYSDLKQLEEDQTLAFRPQTHHQQPLRACQSSSRLSVAERNRLWHEGKEKKLQLIQA